MKKLIAVLTTAILVTGCSSSPPKPPQPSGEWVPVNPPIVMQKG